MAARARYVGYWGSEADLAKVKSNPQGFDDLKTKRFSSLGNAPWREILAASPAHVHDEGPHALRARHAQHRQGRLHPGHQRGRHVPEVIPGPRDSHGAARLHSAYIVMSVAAANERRCASLYCGWRTST